MCGIAGIYDVSQGGVTNLETAQRRMIASLRHRGPDDEGYKLISPDGLDPFNITFGNTRLAIMDLSDAGHQPMLDAATGNYIVLNGEIYNHLEIREALRSESLEWHSESDTETLLRAYATWGESCLERLRGMFAFAIWDAAEEELWCVRDRLGIKPLYYFEGGSTFVFASEVRTLLASGLVPHVIDQDGLAGYIRFGSLPEPFTMVAKVKSLAAGHWVRIKAGTIKETRQYWCATSNPAASTEDDTTQQVRQHIERAVRDHLLADVPVGCFLSGGIDSSIIAALAAQVSDRPLRTFTVGFSESKLDESEYAQLVATRYGTDHQLICLSDGEVAALVPKAVRSMDLPSADGVNTFVVSGAVASAGIKVVLSGLGGDELFGGYRSFKMLPWADRWASLIGRVPAVLRRAAAGGGDAGQRGVEITTIGVQLQKRYESLRAFWSEKELESIGILSTIGYTLNDFPSELLPPPTRVSILELQGYMRSTLLRDGDAMSMAHSLEMRVPFLDHELVECCLRVGAAGTGSKKILLKAYGDLLPGGVADRPKQGFVLPMERWMRGPLQGFVSEGLLKLTRYGVFPRLDLVKLKHLFEVGQLPWARLWEFAVLGIWLDAHFP